MLGVRLLNGPTVAANEFGAPAPFTRNRRRLSLPLSDMIRQHHPDANASAVQTVEAFLLRTIVLADQ